MQSVREMTAEEIQFVTLCISEDRIHDFYVWWRWKQKRKEILDKDKCECQICKAKGRYRRAVVVHHVKHLKDHPELALCDCYLGADGKLHRQLISVCKECHETECHPERMRKKERKRKFSTVERWD